MDTAKAELRQNARPELKAYLDSLDGYGTIFVGYPNWWGTMPMAMFTFLEHYDWSGKRICPFCTNEGSGLGDSEGDLKRACWGATVEKGISIHGAEAAQSQSKVEAWVRKLV
ncbi:flavodoxin [uncultured Intestinimonas sp.]|uniref:flavodoxin n=1 Tax=uncultured Intestinimonas sp. TaxID=1689265 RepID=UPI003421E0BB